MEPNKKELPPDVIEMAADLAQLDRDEREGFARLLRMVRELRGDKCRGSEWLTRLIWHRPKAQGYRQRHREYEKNIERAQQARRQKD